MFSAAPVNPLVFQPEKRLWLRTLFLHAVVVRREPLETAARVLEIPRSTAYRWVQQFRRGDAGALMDKRFGPSAVMAEAGLRKARGEGDDDVGSE